MDNEVNDGVDPSDSNFVDTREGSFYYDITQTVLLEIARLYDAMSAEVPAAALPTYAWGEYLDYWAEVFGLVRKDAVAASGYLTFLGEPGTLLAEGIQATAVATSPDVAAPAYSTTESGTIPDAIVTPSVISLSSVTTVGAGVLPVGTYEYKVAASDNEGETEPITDSITTTDVGRVDLSWTAVTGAEKYFVYRDDQLIGETIGAAFSDGGLAGDADRAPSETNTTGGRRTLRIVANDTGTESNVGAGAVTVLLAGVSGVDSVTNAAPITGGSDIESDSALRDRLLLEFRPGGSGTVNDYERWALANEQVGRATVVPIWDGPGTVKVIIMTADGYPASPVVVSEVQATLDPLPGQGGGLAPIGATVTVTTPDLLAVSVGASVIFESGYSLDGTNGTIATRDEIEARLYDYVDKLNPESNVILNHVEAQFFKVTGVFNVEDVTINGNAEDLAVSTGEVGRLITISLTE